MCALEVKIFKEDNERKVQHFHSECESIRDNE